MRRFLAAAIVGLAALAVLLLGLGAANRSAPGYEVLALFDNAGYAAPGEQVRVAGAPVGTILSETVTRQNLAALTLKITASGFGDWRSDATCTIRPESLIAERYLDCSPGSAPHPSLALIRHGIGAGAHLLGVDRTSSPIDPDIVQDISTEPVRDALATILDELGTGLAARGADLGAVIQRADPGLAATDRVFALLAAQRATLARLASDSDAVLAPLAQARAQLAAFVTGAASTASAAATRQAAIAQSIRDLPPLLARLRPLMSDLGDLARQGTPDLANLGASGAALNREFTALVPFAAEAHQALDELSRAAAQSEAHLVASQSLATRLGSLGAAAAPAAGSLAALTTSLTRTDAIAQLMALLINGAGATNGFDADGHYLRTDVIVGSCTAYARSAVPGCSANFDGTPGSSTSTSTSTGATAQPALRSTSGSSGWSASSASAASTSAASSAPSTAGTASTRALSGLLGYLTGSGR